MKISPLSYRNYSTRNSVSSKAQAPITASKVSFHGVAAMTDETIQLFNKAHKLLETGFKKIDVKLDNGTTMAINQVPEYLKNVSKIGDNEIPIKFKKLNDDADIIEFQKPAELDLIDGKYLHTLHLFHCGDIRPMTSATIHGFASGGGMPKPGETKELNELAQKLLKIFTAE